MHDNLINSRILLSSPKHFSFLFFLLDSATKSFWATLREPRKVVKFIVKPNSIIPDSMDCSSVAAWGEGQKAWLPGCSHFQARPFRSVSSGSSQFLSCGLESKRNQTKHQNHLLWSSWTAVYFRVLPLEPSWISRELLFAYSTLSDLSPAW